MKYKVLKTVLVCLSVCANVLLLCFFALGFPNAREVEPHSSQLSDEQSTNPPEGNLHGIESNTSSADSSSQNYENGEFPVQKNSAFNQLFHGKWAITEFLIPKSGSLPRSYSAFNENGSFVGWNINRISSIIGEEIVFEEEYAEYLGERHFYSYSPETSTHALLYDEQPIGGWYTAKELEITGDYYSVILFLLPGHQWVAGFDNNYNEVRIDDLYILLLKDNETIYACNGNIMYRLERVAKDSSPRRPVIVERDSAGVFDAQSLFSHSMFKGSPEMSEGGYAPPYLATIYRTIHPWDGTGSVLASLSHLYREKPENMSSKVSDALVSYLLTEASVRLSDVMLYFKLSTITEAYIFSKHTDSMNYRLIALNLGPDGANSPWMSWSYCIQVWNDENIWAQPLCEGTEFKFDQAVFVTVPESYEIVLLAGRTERPIGTSFAVAGVGFAFEDGIWSPIKWVDMYSDTANIGNVRTASDGFYMLYYDNQMAQSFSLPLHEGPLFDLELETDGSFWADYSKYPEYPANTSLPPGELLFSLG